MTVRKHLVYHHLICTLRIPKHDCSISTWASLTHLLKCLASHSDETLASDRETCRPVSHQHNTTQHEQQRNISEKFHLFGSKFPLITRIVSKLHWWKTDLRPVWDPNASDLMGHAWVRQGIDPSFDEPFLPEKSECRKPNQNWWKQYDASILLLQKITEGQQFLTCLVRTICISLQVA